MGFCSSYAEVQRFEKNAADAVTSDVLGGPLPDMVVFAADSDDHNILTIDGKGTFYGMGMIASGNNTWDTTQPCGHKENVSLVNVKEMAQVNITDYYFLNYARRQIMFKTLPKLYCAAPTVDILWEFFCVFIKKSPIGKE